MSDYTPEFLKPLVAVGGNSSAARSARARAQWRDRYGRWIEMGRGANFSLRLRDGSVVSVNGRFVGVAADNNFGQVYVANDVSGIPDGFYEVSSSNAEKIGATLSADYLAKQGVDTDTVIEQPRSEADIQSEDTIVRLDAPVGWKQSRAVGGGFETEDGEFEIIPEGTRKAPTYSLVQNGREVGNYKTLPEGFVSAASIDAGEGAKKSTAANAPAQKAETAPEPTGYEVREASDEGFLVPTGTDSETVSAEDWSANAPAQLASYVTKHKASLTQPGRRLVADMNDDGSVTFDVADHVATQEEADALSANRTSNPEGAGNAPEARNPDAVEPGGDDAGSDQGVVNSDGPDVDALGQPIPGDRAGLEARVAQLERAQGRALNDPEQFKRISEALGDLGTRLENFDNTPEAPAEAAPEAGADSDSNNEVAKARAEATDAKLEAVDAKLDAINAKLDRDAARAEAPAPAVEIPEDSEPLPEGPVTIVEEPEAPAERSNADILAEALAATDPNSDSNLDRRERNAIKALQAAEKRGNLEAGYARLQDDEKSALGSELKQELGLEPSPEAMRETAQTTPEPEFSDPTPFRDADGVRWESAEAFEEQGGDPADLEELPRTEAEYNSDRGPGAAAEDALDAQEEPAPAPARAETDSQRRERTGDQLIRQAPAQPAQAAEPTPWDESGVPAAAAYDAMAHDPANPEVQASYQALEEAVIDQYREMKASGLNVTFAEGDPYPDSAAMAADVRDGNLQTFADHGATLPADHPMNKTIDIDGEQLHLNDVFRAVHDYFGHVKSADRGAVVSFGPKGEWEAWRTHRQTLPRDSWQALWTETRGQNAWTNYNGDNASLPIVDRPYAEQKAGVVPEEFSHADLIGDEPAAAPEASPSVADERNAALADHIKSVDIGLEDARARAAAIGTELTDAISAGDFGSIPEIQTRLTEVLDEINMLEDRNTIFKNDQEEPETPEAPEVEPEEDTTAFDEEMEARAAQTLEDWANAEADRLKEAAHKIERQNAPVDELTDAELQDQLDTLAEADNLARMASDTLPAEDLDRLDALRTEQDRRNNPEASVTPEQTGEPSTEAEVIELTDSDPDPDGADLDGVPATAGDSLDEGPTAEQTETLDALAPGELDAATEAKLTFQDSDEDYADMKFMPTKQQRNIVRSVLSGNDTAVEALAGTGKTSTLELIARRLKEVDPNKKILYVAFNKSVKLEADGRMPDNVIASTADGLSWNSLDPSLVAKGDSRKNSNLLSLPSDIANHLGVTRDDGDSAIDVVRGLKKVIDKFTISDRDEVTEADFEAAEVEYSDKRLAWAKDMWNDIADPKGQMKITNNHVTKMWGLSNPDMTKGVSGSKGRRIVPDLIFFDEAQDSNPVVAKIIREQSDAIQKVYVGDGNQAIYGFRGAVDELSKVQVDVRLPLTESWRFGPEVAGMGNRFLAFSDAKHRVVGGGAAGEVVPSGSMTDADAVLTRSNGGAMKAIIDELEAGRTVGVTENFKKSLSEAIDSIETLQAGRTARSKLSEDFSGYQSWTEVEEDIEKDKASARVVMYANLVAKYGTSGLRDSLNRVVVAGKDSFGDTAADDSADAPLAPGLVRPGIRYTHTNGTVSLKAFGNDFAKNLADIKATGKFRFNGATKSWDSRTTVADDELENFLSPLSSATSRATAPEKIDVVVTTAHQSKGLEWDNVRIGDDFRGPRDVVNKATGETETIMPDPEEIRLAYVAVTRAAKKLDPGALDWIMSYTDDSDEDPNTINTREASESSNSAPEGDGTEVVEPAAAAGELPELVVPEGVDLPDLDKPFEETEIERPADAPDTWTADPAELADTHTREELEEVLADAVKDPERAHVTTDGIDTPVDVRVAYEAVNEAGGDPRRIVAETLDDIAGTDTNEKNLNEAYTDAPELAPEGFVPATPEKDVTSSTPGTHAPTASTHENQDLATPIALDPEPYVPQGTGIDGTTDDPDVIAQSFPVVNLEQTFKDAIVNGNSDIRLTFGDDELAPEANVPIEAVRDAIQKRGKDTNKLIDSVVTPDSSDDDIFNDLNPIFATPITPEEQDFYQGDEMSRMPDDEKDILKRHLARKDISDRKREAINDLIDNWLSNVHGDRLLDHIRSYPDKAVSDVETPVKENLKPKAQTLSEITDPGLIMDEIKRVYNAEQMANGDLKLTTRTVSDANGNRRTYEQFAVRTGNEFFYVYERETNHVTGEVRSRRVSRMTHSARALGNQIDSAASRLHLSQNPRARFENSKVGTGVQIDQIDAETGEYTHIPEEPIYRPQLNAIRKTSGLGQVSDEQIRDIRDTILRDGADQAMIDAIQGSTSLTPEQAQDLIDAINEQVITTDSNLAAQTWSSADGRTPLLEGDRVQYENEEDGSIRWGVVNRRIAKRDSKGYAYSDNVNVKWDDGGVNSDIISRRLTILHTADGTDGSERRGPGFVIPPVEETRRAELARERFKPTASKTVNSTEKDGEYFIDGNKVTIQRSDTLRESDFKDLKFRDLEVGDRFMTADGDVREIISFNRAQRYITIETATATSTPGEYEKHTYKVTPAQKIRANRDSSFKDSIEGRDKRALLRKINDLQRDGMTKGWWPEEGFTTLPKVTGIDNWTLTSLKDIVTDLTAHKDTYVAPPAPEPTKPEDKYTFPAPGERRQPGELQGVDLSNLANRFPARPGTTWDPQPSVDPFHGGYGEDMLNLELWKQLGYTAKPELKSDEEFEASVWYAPQGYSNHKYMDPAKGAIRDDLAPVLYRGLRQNGNTTPEMMHDQLRNSDLPFSGLGVYGNGSYFSVDKSIADAYGEVQRYYLDEGAVGISEAEISKVQMEWAKAFREGKFDYLPASEKAVLHTIIKDWGRLASMLGYDYINATGPGIHGVVLLNRGKLVGLENYERNVPYPQ